MDWLRLDSSYFDHPKHGRLGRKLDIPRERAATLVIRMWCWVARVREDGDLSDIDPEDLADAVGWDGNAADLLEALIHAGWIERNSDLVTVHDWMTHQGKSSRASALHAERQKRYRDRKASGTPTVTPSDATASRTGDAAPSRRDETRRDETRRDGTEEASAEPPRRRSTPAPPPGPVLVEFPTVGESPRWGLPQSVADELGEAYPDLDVPAEARKALAWIQADPARRKTPRGMRRFLVSWLNRATDFRRAPPGPGFVDRTEPKAFAGLREFAARGGFHGDGGGSGVGHPALGPGLPELRPSG